MLNLVDYSDSEGELSDVDEQSQGVTVTVKKNKKINQIESQTDESNVGQFENSVFFNQLPKPKDTQIQVKEELDEFLLKKELPSENKPKKPKANVKISIPSLKDFDSDDEDENVDTNTKNSALKASGLFAILPPPKTTPITTKSFIPHVLKRKMANPQKKHVETVPMNIIQDSNKRKKENMDSDDEDPQMETFDEETWLQVCGRKKKAVKPIVETPNVSFILDATPEAPEPYSGLDNEAFKQLVGSGKMKKENIKLVDVNEEEVMPERDVWMAKALTDPESKPKYVVQDPVNDTCKKKHHITYLAQQAKANEQELQNQWSQSRFSRKQTQAKYGF